MLRLAHSPSSAVPALPNLSEASMTEMYLLSLSEEEWQEVRGTRTPDGRPLVEHSADGSVIIHDEMMADFHRRMLANAKAK